MMEYTILPAVNASLNFVAGVLLMAGLYFIKQKDKQKHKLAMLSAFAVSVIFLGCYLLHKWLLFEATGTYNTVFQGEGFWRIVYFVMLITHVILAAAVPVLAIITLRLGLKDDVEKHRRIAKITFPIWMYVSVTGVLIYFMLYQWFSPTI